LGKRAESVEVLGARGAFHTREADTHAHWRGRRVAGRL